MTPYLVTNKLIKIRSLIVQKVSVAARPANLISNFD